MILRLSVAMSTMRRQSSRIAALRSVGINSFSANESWILYVCCNPYHSATIKRRQTPYCCRYKRFYNQVPVSGAYT